ncbi:MAG: hypothetical protein QXW94_03995 [Desulfurococcaceae archaeon]
MSDVDAAGVVYFTNYFRLCEEAEVEFLNSLGLEADRIRERYGVWFPRVHE